MRKTQQPTAELNVPQSNTKQALRPPGNRPNRSARVRVRSGKQKVQQAKNEAAAGKLREVIDAEGLKMMLEKVPRKSL